MMNIVKKCLPIIILLFAMIFIITGCRSEAEGNSNSGAQDRELKVGFIDSDKLLFEYPEFKSFMKKKEKESEFIRKKIENAKKLGKFSNEDKTYIKDLTKDFMLKEQNILKEFVEQVRTASQKVQDEKKLDLVINHAGTSPVIEYGGIDITEDVQAKMVELRKQGNSKEREEKETKK